MALDGSRGGYYRQRADEVRAVAENCIDATVKIQLEKVAQEYEALARSVEKGMLGR